MAVRKGRVTSIDVAREAGVSQTTVSYVLNNVTHQKISAETKRRVLEAVERLGYTPSAAARTLRRGRSDIVLLVLHDVPIGPTVAQLIEDLTDDLERHGLTAITRRERHLPLAALWRELMPAAVIGFSTISQEDEASMRAAGVHVVVARLLDPGSGSTGALSIPQTQIGRLQAEHLVGRGHRNLGYAAPDDPRVREFYDLRLAGVRAACAELGVEPPVVLEVPLEVAAATVAVSAWHGAEPRVTGVCAYNDETAFALLAGARELGLSVPGALAVIGVDNIPLSRLAAPPLTTIDQNTAAVAAHLTEMIMDGILGGKSVPASRTETVTLVVRAST